MRVLVGALIISVLISGCMRPYEFRQNVDTIANSTYHSVDSGISKIKNSSVCVSYDNSSVCTSDVKLPHVYIQQVKK